MHTNPFREHRAKVEALELEEKKKLDSVDKDELKGTHADRKDSDIDNDGDEDKSDKYLHKKRKAISKSIKSKEEAVKEDPAHYAAIAKNNAAQQAKRDAADPEAAKKRKAAIAALDKKPAVKPADIGRHSSQFIGRRNEETMTFREKLISVLERKEHYKGATEPETMDDKLKGKGAKDMAQPAKDAITAKPTIDEPEIIKKDFNKMTSNVKKSPMRKNDNAKGDSTIIAPGTPMNDPNKVQKEDFTAHPMNGKSMKDLLDAIKEVKADSIKTAK